MEKTSIHNLLHVSILKKVASTYFPVGGRFFLFTHAHLALRITIINIRTESLPWNVSVSLPLFSPFRGLSRGSCVLNDER